MAYPEYLSILQRGDIEAARKYIYENPMAINSLADDGIPMVLHAAETGNAELLEYLIHDTLTKVNLRDENGAGLLHYAARNSSADLLRWLTEQMGFDPLQSDRNGQTPFEAAHEWGNTEGEAYFAHHLGFELKDCYKNPVNPGFMPDPTIIRVGEDYYTVNSSFTWYPALPISHSKDLVHWERVGYVFDENNAPGLLNGIDSGHGLWAPDISYHDGRFYVVVTLRRNDSDFRPRAQLVTSAPRPEGPYDPPAVIEVDGIDPSLFTDDDGKRYMLVNRGARLIPLTDDARAVAGPVEMIWGGHNHRASEGPHLMKKDGWYYLILAEGGTGMGHQISIARSKNLRGPYEPCVYNPVLHQYDTEQLIQRSGHGDFVQTQNGDWWVVYLCSRRKDGFSLLGRETALDPIRWTEDGWPIVNERRGPSVLQKRPELPVFTPTPDSKDPSAPNTLWASQRCPTGAQWENGVLTLPGDSYDLDSTESRAGLYTRQKDPSFCWTVCLENLPTQNAQAGICAYYDEHSYLKFGVSEQSCEYILKATLKDGYNKTDIKTLSCPKTEKLWLRMETSNLCRNVLYSTNGTDWTTFATLPHMDCLADEGVGIGKRFTGPMIGVYALGEKASFSQIKYQATK